MGVIDSHNVLIGLLHNVQYHWLNLTFHACPHPVRYKTRSRRLAALPIFDDGITFAVRRRTDLIVPLMVSSRLAPALFYSSEKMNLSYLAVVPVRY